MAFLAVHVSPKAGRDEVVGVQLHDQGLREVQLRVTAAPDKGAANKAVCKLLAKELGIPKSSVSVKRGETARHKAIELQMDEEALEQWLQSIPQID